MKLNHKHSMLTASLALVVLAGIAAWKWIAAPKYDLLYSVDTSNLPYANPDNWGFVIPVKNHKANVIFTGYWGGFLAPDIPDLYVCGAASGTSREIHIPIQLPWKPMREGFPEPIGTPELESLTVDESSVAPDGHSVPGVVDFVKTYDVISLVHEPLPHDSKLSDSTYKQCLERVEGHGGLFVHFIGWVIP